MNDLHVKPVAYEVTAYPFEDANRESYTLRVESRGNGRWAVLRGRLCYARDGGASFEPIPSERTDAWLARHRFTLTEAMRIAEEAAPLLRVNGRSIADMTPAPPPVAAHTDTGHTAHDERKLA